MDFQVQYKKYVSLKLYIALLYAINISEIQFYTLSMSWDILAGAKSFLLPILKLSLIVMVMDYHFEVFFKKRLTFTSFIWTQFIDLISFKKLR